MAGDDPGLPVFCATERITRYGHTSTPFCLRIITAHSPDKSTHGDGLAWNKCVAQVAPCFTAQSVCVRALTFSGRGATPAPRLRTRCLTGLPRGLRQSPVACLLSTPPLNVNSLP